MSPGSMQHRLRELSFGKPIRQHVADFGALFAVIAAGVSCVLGYQGASISRVLSWGMVSLLLYSLGRWSPQILYWPWRAWMAFAHLLSIVMTTVLMVLVWIVFVIPMGFLLRLLGKRLMDLSFREGAATYWVSRTEKSDEQARMKMQF